MNEKKNNQAVWDKKNSTFMRIIYLQNGYALTGYSKKFLQNERRDKTDLLTNWILRDFKNGYLNRHTTNPKITPVERIEYFTRVNDTFQQPVITLYYDFPEWTNPKSMDNKKFFVFITKLYWMIRNRISESEIINALEVRTRASSQDPFEISKPRFSHMEDLNAYVARLKSQAQYEDAAIENFYMKYKEKYFTKKINPNV